MKTKFCLAAVAAILLMPVTMKAQAPAGATGQCKDGSYTQAKNKRGACGGHGGVANWLTAPAASTATTPAPAPTPAPTPAPAPKPAPVSAPAGNGQVWVNTDTHVYHCAGTRWYGKTKAGKYLSESQAKAEGDKPAYSKDCAK